MHVIRRGDILIAMQNCVERYQKFVSPGKETMYELCMNRHRSVRNQVPPSRTYRQRTP